ncbi:MAG: hypothetical protein IPL36_13990 [Nigerium sp.]|nr:hypothetical protein [Nigerium sp.]
MITTVVDADALGRVYDDILRPSFPETERATREVFVAGGCSGRFDVLGVYEGDACAGAIVGERFGGAMLVVWLAVGGAARGGGTGSALIAAGLERWISLPGVRLVLGEVERPDLFEAHPEHGDPARRLAFYARLGAGALTLPYYQPPSSEGMPRIPGLLLVALATTDATPLPRMLSAEETDAVRSYLLSAMGAPAEGDVETQAAFAAVDAPTGLRLLPLEDYAEIPLPPRVEPVR